MLIKLVVVKIDFDTAENKSSEVPEPEWAEVPHPEWTSSPEYASSLRVLFSWTSSTNHADEVTEGKLSCDMRWYFHYFDHQSNVSDFANSYLIS